jgi:hypothetical protein
LRDLHQPSVDTGTIEGANSPLLGPPPEVEASSETRSNKVSIGQPQSPMLLS